ncbi:hypothetical protein ACSVDE_12770 [Pseudalkalibacillus sp. Hm43]|uniref:hypothetical protein n=1 Tax=Pseudalkalibacillus sp. Hm43 TaxID=3450742 RepID=UPI003F423074
MSEHIIIMVIVYLLLGYTRLLDRTKHQRKENIFYMGVLLLSFYLSLLFVTGTDGFNLNDLLDWPFEMPARGILKFFTS